MKGGIVPTMSWRLLVLLALLGVLVVAAGTAVSPARAADECRGLPVCLPVAGPWVVIPAGRSGQVSTTRYDLRCPLRGYVVAGVDARLSDRRIDVSYRAETGSPVAPGVTTGRSVVFTGAYAGAERKTTSFRPFIGCVPTSGGGGRAATGHAPSRTPAAFRPGKPTELRVATVQVGPGAARSATARCARGDRLISASHAIGFYTPEGPPSALVQGVRVARSVRGGVVTARIAAAASLPTTVIVELQVLAFCARGGR